MASPSDIRAAVRADGSVPSRTFTVEEANRVLAAIEGIFHTMDNRHVRRREVSDLIEDLASYWGDQLVGYDCPDRGNYVRLLRERDDLQSFLEEDTERIHALGASLKDYSAGLVDFYGQVDGALVLLCWQRGEPEVKFFHPLEGGYSARQPLTRGPKK